MPCGDERDRQHTTPARRIKAVLFHALLIIAPLAVVELGAAVYLNFLASNPRSLAVRNIPWHVYEPYRNHAVGPGWRSQGVIHNRQGFRRTTDVARIKPANAYRIFLMG